MSLADIRSRWGHEPTGISANLMLLIKFQRLLFIHLYQLQEDEVSRPECKDELSGSVSILKKYLTSITDHLADVVTVATSVIEAASVTGIVAITGDIVNILNRIFIRICKNFVFQWPARAPF